MSTNQPNLNYNSKKREQMLPSGKTLLRLGLKPNHCLADLGCGPGYFAIRAAELVGAQGMIKAIDINPERIENLRRTSEERGVADRIETYIAEGESIPLPDSNVNIALIANVLHELSNPLSYLRDALRIIKNEGELWVIEWQKKVMPMGPPLEERRSFEEWVALLKQAGFHDIWGQISQSHILIRSKVNKDK